MDRKKITSERLIEKISLKFGSVEKYAESKNTSRQNIYNKINKKSTRFLVELQNDGVIISEPETEYKVTSEYLSPQIIKLQNKVDQLEAMQKEILERMDKRDEELTQIIENLVEDNKKLRVLFSEGGMLGPFQSKLKR